MIKITKVKKHNTKWAHLTGPFQHPGQTQRRPLLPESSRGMGKPIRMREMRGVKSVQGTNILISLEIPSHLSLD